MDGSSRKRHRSVMGPATAGERAGRPGAKRFQVPRACQRCKALRRGCDERRPCQRCIRAGLGEQCSASSASAWPRASVVSEPAAVQRRVIELAQAPMVDASAHLFFEHFHPTIPILMPGHVAHLRAAALSREPDVEACTLLVSMCAHVLLYVEAAGIGVPSSPTILPEDPEMDWAVSLECGVGSASKLVLGLCPFPRSMPPRFSSCMPARPVSLVTARHFLLLREATTLWSLVNDHKRNGDVTDVLLDRLFWVLLISERSHAIRYDRSITLHITSRTPDIDIHDASLSGFWSLAALFRPVDSAFMAMKNGEVTASSPSSDLLDDAERAINAAIPPSAVLKDMQKSNLRITSLWLRVIIWQLRLRLGYLTETSLPQ